MANDLIGGAKKRSNKNNAWTKHVKEFAKTYKGKNLFKAARPSYKKPK